MSVLVGCRGFLGVSWLLLIASIFCTAGQRSGGACDVIFGPFFACAKDYYDGVDVSDRRFASTLRDMIESEVAETQCPEARALALVLTAEFVYMLMAPFAALLADQDDEHMQGQYMEDLDRASMLYTWHAMNLSVQEGFDLGPLLRRGLSRALSVKTRTEDQPVSHGETSMGVHPHPESTAAAAAAVAAQIGRNAFLAAVEDHLFNEVWVPVMPNVALAWGLPHMDGADQHTMKRITELPPSDWVWQQEKALAKGVMAAYEVFRVALLFGFEVWPIRSTLIALLRYGELFGEFSAVETDCVDDDLDFAVGAVSDKEWVRFILFVAFSDKGFLQTGWSCFQGGNATAVALTGIFTQLLCTKYIDGWLVPVTIERDQREYPFNDIAECLLYGAKIPCRKSVAAELVRYPGCVALPDISLSAFSIGNACVEWMSQGLRPDYVYRLLSTWQHMQEEGCLSMLNIWEVDHDCRQIAKQWSELPADVAQQRIHVGTLNSSLKDFYREPEQTTGDKPSCRPTLPQRCGLSILDSGADSPYCFRDEQQLAQR